MEKTVVIGMNRTRFLGYAGLALFALFACFGTAIAYVGLGFLMIATLANTRPAWRLIAGDSVFIALLIFSTYTVGRAVSAAQQLPALSHDQYASLWPWLALLLFPLVALWTQGDSRRVRFILVLSLVGLLLAIGRMTDWKHLSAYMHGARSSFGMTFLDSALYLGSALLGWITFAKRIIGQGRWRYIRLVGWLSMAALLAEMLLMTQSRAVLGSLLVLIPAIIIRQISRTKNSRLRGRYAAFFLVGIAAVGILGFFNHTGLSQRINATYHSVYDIATMPPSKVPYTSLGDRIHLYRFAIHKWLQHPVWGWGPGMEAATFFSAAPINPATNAHFPHLHDGYLEILVRFGTVGFVLVFLLAGLIATRFLQEWRRGHIPEDIALFLASASVLTALTNITTFRLIHLYFRFFTLLLAGLAYGYILYSARSRAHQSNISPTSHRR